jgi:hypothetical protein
MKDKIISFTSLKQRSPYEKNHSLSDPFDQLLDHGIVQLLPK